MNAEYGAKPITCPKPVLRRRVWSSYALEPVVNFDFQWAGRHPAHQRAINPHTNEAWWTLLGDTINKYNIKSMELMRLEYRHKEVVSMNMFLALKQRPLLINSVLEHRKISQSL